MNTETVISLNHCMLPLIPLSLLLTGLFLKLLIIKDESLFLQKTVNGFQLLFNLYGWSIFLLFASLRHGQLFAGFTETVYFSALLVSSFQQLGEFVSKTKRVGLFSNIAILAMLLIALALPEKNWSSQTSNGLFITHLIFSLSAYSFYTISTILISMYLLLDHKLKKKSFDSVFLKLPPLGKLESYSSFWILLGILFSITGFLFGYFWRSTTGGEGLMENGKVLILLPFLSYLLTWIGYSMQKIRGKLYCYLSLGSFTLVFAVQSLLYFLY